MTKSTIIIISIVWLLCTSYYTLSRAYDYPYATAAMVGAWIASALLLICIVIYARKHASKK